MPADSLASAAPACPRVALLSDSRAQPALISQITQTLDRFGVSWVVRSAPWTGAVDLSDVVAEVTAAGAQVLIVADASREPLSAAVAGLTALPVLAVPCPTPDLPSLDALRATTRPGGAPVASLAVGKAGASNAALLAVAILATADPALAGALAKFRAEQTAQVLAEPALGLG